MSDLPPDPNAGPTLVAGTATQNAASTLNSDVTSLSSALGTTDSTGQTDTFVGTADSAADSSAPQTDSSTRVQLKTPKRPDDLVHGNILDPYIDVIYNLSLSMISKDAQTRVYQAGVQDVVVNPNDYIVFASTGDVKTNSTAAIETFGDKSDLNYQGDYYNIQSLTFTSVVAHVPQNPIVAAIWDGKMKMFQPYGFKLKEDIDDMAHQLGYQSTTGVDFVYRLEIWFSGYDPATGEWKSNIDVPVPQADDNNRTVKSIVYFLVVTAMEAHVIPTGTEYNLSFQTVSHNATRAESIMMLQDNMKTGGVQLKGQKGQQFRDFLQSLGDRLHKQVLIDTLYRIKITYEFYGLKQLFDATFINDVEVDFSTGVSFNQDSGSYAVAGKNIDIYTMVNHVMMQLKLVRDLLLRKDNPELTEPGVCAWNIRTNIAKADKFDPEINCYTEYTYQYIFEPVLTFRCRTVEPKLRNRQVDFSNQQARAQALINYGMLYRVYNYFFTNQNSEVIDFDFTFKNFYYAPFPYAGTEIAMRGHSQGTDDRDRKKDDQERLKAESQASQQSQDAATAPNLLFSPTPGRDLSQVLDIPLPQSAPNNKSAGNMIGYMQRSPSISSGHNLSTAEKYEQEVRIAKDQYLRYDQIQTNMTVRFDPTWLLNPYVSGRDSTPEVPLENSENGVFVYAHTDRAIFLKAYRPEQSNFMNPNPVEASQQVHPILGGFYQVIWVVNQFEGGRFYQKLNMIKYDHLNYFNSLDATNPSVAQFDVNNQTTTTTPSNSSPGTNQPDSNTGGDTAFGPF